MRTGTPAPDTPGPGHEAGGNGEGKPGATGRLMKRSMVIAGHRTSISLENLFWTSLKAIAAARGQSIASLVADIDETRGEANLSSAIRVFVLEQALESSSSRTKAGSSPGLDETEN
jgi:predicted DNA-binding ribbon-helix-helix protein